MGYLVYLETTVDPSIIGGSVLKAGDQIYDASVKRQMEKVSDAMAKNNAKGSLTDFSAVAESLAKTVEETDIKPDMEEVGTIEKVGDGIATVTGLGHAMAGELVSLNGGVSGMVQNLMPDRVGIVLMGGETTVKQGDIVRRTGKLMQVPVGDGLLGRVVNPLGEPIDGLGEIKYNATRPVESPSPGIADRKPVDVPLQTGIKAIDAMVPIGRGQRELIIGDRGTGKSAIAIDTIINQKGNGVICVYVAIGQKASTVARLSRTLENMAPRTIPSSWPLRPPSPRRCSTWLRTPAFPWPSISWIRAKTCSASTTTCPSTPWPIAPCPCCSAVRPDAKRTLAMSSICTPACWNARPVGTNRPAAAPSRPCRSSRPWQAT